MRNVLTIPFHGTDTLIIASDNSGAIGMKEDDLVQVPYETVAYYSFRVAVMECISAGGKPISIILNNFCGNEAWEKLINGIQKGLSELDLKDIAITGSTESNFSMLQSAIGIFVLGKKQLRKTEKIIYNEHSKIAIVGNPLVGNEVIQQEDQIASLALFQKISRLEGVWVWPVGSKGILFELNQMFTNKEWLKDNVITDVDVLKSSGPATCFIALYQENQGAEIKELSGSYFHPVKLLS